jgi:ubiquinone/menaquinone biosynthesis C-methylase UbiE
MACLDVGCGGGEVSFDLARLVEPGGRVLAMDVDDVKISIGRAEAKTQQITNIDFQIADLEVCELAPEFDLAHARFILQHLQNPERLLAKIWKALRPGGVVVVTDTDFRGYFSEPDSPDLRRHVELYTETLKRRGGDANIGPRLPALLTRSGFENVQMSVVQHAATDGEIKLITPMTMENVAEAVVAEGLASPAEVERVVSELYKFARDPSTVLSGPRIIQTWAYRPPV